MHVQAGDMQRLMDRLLNDRDKALEVDPEHSGTPSAFAQYCRTSLLTENLGRPFYRAQAESHVANLAFRIENLNKDIDKANVQRSDLVAQAIHLLMESARLGLAQNNPGAVVGAVAQLDKLCGLSIARR